MGPNSVAISPVELGVHVENGLHEIIARRHSTDVSSGQPGSVAIHHRGLVRLDRSYVYCQHFLGPFEARLGAAILSENQEQPARHWSSVYRGRKTDLETCRCARRHSQRKTYHQRDGNGRLHGGNYI